MVFGIIGISVFVAAFGVCSGLIIKEIVGAKKEAEANLNQKTSEEELYKPLNKENNKLKETNKNIQAQNKNVKHKEDEFEI